MSDYTHILLISSETAEIISDEIVNRAGDCGLAILVNGEGGLTPLSKNFPTEETERLSGVLPKGVEARKANGILHKLSYRPKMEKSLPEASGLENSATLQR